MFGHCCLSLSSILYEFWVPFHSIIIYPVCFFGLRPRKQNILCRGSLVRLPQDDPDQILVFLYSSINCTFEHLTIYHVILVSKFFLCIFDSLFFNIANFRSFDLISINFSMINLYHCSKHIKLELL